MEKINQILQPWITILILQSVTHLAFSQEGMSNNVVMVNELVKRHKRSDDVINYGLTSAEMNDAVNVHNDLRRFINASNMEYLIWNDALASMAAEWAQGCKWGHGQPPMHEDIPYIQLGQNLYYNTGIRNVTHAIRRWYYAEVDYYDHATGACSGMCGHYTQLIWAPSREVGCAYHLCGTLTDMANGKVYNNAWYFACNYGPAGNVNGKRPYIGGPSCRDCPSGQYWCDKTSPRGLCRRDCDISNQECECRADCGNGGAPDCDCRCSCADGWTDFRCSKECIDYNSHCGKTPGYPEYSCRDPQHGESIKNLCPKLCGVCKGARGNDSGIVEPCSFSEFTTTEAASPRTTISSEPPTSTISLAPTDWSSGQPEEPTTETPLLASSSVKTTALVQVSPTNGFVDDAYIAWIYLESMRPEEIQQVKDILQQMIADAVNNFCKNNNCCPANKAWISGMLIQKEDVDIKPHSWVNSVTKASVTIRLHHVCSSDSYSKTRSDDSHQVFLPKDFLMTILQDKMASMNSTLHDCCRISLISVEETDVPPGDKEQPGYISKKWITAVVIIVVNAVLVIIAVAIAYAIKRRMTKSEKEATVLNMEPARQRQFNHPADQSFNSSAYSSSTYEIPYSHYDIPKPHHSMSEPYSSLDNTTNEQHCQSSGHTKNQLHYLYGFSDSQTSI